MLTAVLLYSCIAAACAFAGAVNYRHRMLEVFISDFIIAALGAWLGGMLAGSFGPAVGGIPLAAALGVAAPLVVLFNLITVPLTEERIIQREPAFSVSPEPAVLHDKLPLAPVEPISTIAEPVIAAVDSTLQSADPTGETLIPALELPGAASAPIPFNVPPAASANDLPEVA